MKEVNWLWNKIKDWVHFILSAQAPVNGSSDLCQHYLLYVSLVTIYQDVAPPSVRTFLIQIIFSDEQFLRALHKLRPISYIIQRPLLWEGGVASLCVNMHLHMPSYSPTSMSPTPSPLSPLPFCSQSIFDPLILPLHCDSALKLSPSFCPTQRRTGWKLTHIFINSHGCTKYRR